MDAPLLSVRDLRKYFPIAGGPLGFRTVGIYAQEDRLSVHRFKADEAYQVGIGKGPVICSNVETLQ